MDNPRPASTVEWIANREPGSLFVDLMGIDAATQATYQLRVPVHLLESFRDFLADVIRQRPDVFSGIDTQPLD